MKRLQNEISNITQEVIGTIIGASYCALLITFGLLAVLWYEIQERLTPKNKKSC